MNDELRKNGIEPTVVDTKEISLPFPGFPDTPDAEQLRSLIRNASEIVLATPEYYGTFSAMTKLIIENLGSPSMLSGKPVA